MRTPDERDRWDITFDGIDIPVAVDHPSCAGTDTICVVLAHGAGSHMDHPSVMATSRALGSIGATVIRFNFPYRAVGRGRPNPMPQLQLCYSGVVESVPGHLGPGRLILSGRSMGGRVASMLVADGLACDGLLTLAYPLHPVGRTESLRSGHLDRITVPALCINGTRDKLCRRDLMDSVVAALGSRFEMHWIEGADHSFNVVKRSGRTSDDVFDEITRTVDDWLTRI